MKRDIPNITKDIGLDFWWDTKKLWTEEAPIEKLPIKDFEWMFHLPFWTDNGKEMSLRPIEVIKNPQTHIEQYNRTMETDLSYPIAAINIDNKWVIMDGLHRALKAYIQKNELINVKKFYKGDIPRIEL
ncbi:hypothetical protein HYV31_00765 [candidate division WWE3 bacterium]|nr:hypothetical protein [candidate division WWE3 bacterium]